MPGTLVAVYGRVMTLTRIATPHRVVPCAGVPITACRPDEAAAEVVNLAGGTGGADVHLCNAFTLALADADTSLHDVLTSATRNFPDGKSVVWANQLLHRGANIPSERVYGPDLFVDVLARTEHSDITHYLLGGSSDTLVRLEQAIAARFPGVTISGRDSPPFRAPTAAELRVRDDQIRASGARVVWVGLGTPKQDLEAARLASSTSVVAVAVGAAFDFVAGTKPQAPLWMQRNGLEWAFRLGSEPRRLWKRYLIGNARFVAAAARRRSACT